MNSESDIIRRQLSRLAVRTPAAMPEQPYTPPVSMGTITKNETTGATSGAVAIGDYAIINEFANVDPNNAILIPTGNASLTGWSGSFASIDDSPWDNAVNLSDFIATSTPNATARFQFTDLPDTAVNSNPVYSVIIAIVARRISGGSLNLEKIQIVNANDTVEWTEPNSMSLGADWVLATFRQQIIGTPSHGSWGDATLKFKVDSGSGGTVQIAAAAIRVQFDFSTAVNFNPYPRLTGVMRTAFNRLEATAVGKTVFYEHMPWGYEIVKAQP